MDNPSVTSRKPRIAARAVWSLLCGILAIVCFGPVTGVAAIALGDRAIFEIDQTGGALRGRDMAGVGVVLGYAGTLLFIPVLLFLAPFLVPFLVSYQGGPGLRAWAGADEAVIVAAVKSYYTEYGRYPGSAPSSGDLTYSANNNLLFDVLRGGTADNPQKIPFFEGHLATGRHLRRGFDAQGVYLDPWGRPYFIRIDMDYDGQLDDPYASHPSDARLELPVIVWSLGPDGTLGDHGDSNRRADPTSW